MEGGKKVAMGGAALDGKRKDPVKKGKNAIQ